jgi:hypothetical protein
MLAAEPTIFSDYFQIEVLDRDSTAARQDQSGMFPRTRTSPPPRHRNPDRRPPGVDGGRGRHPDRGTATSPWP